MKAGAIALVITFAGLAIILNPAISGVGIPYPLLTGLIFQIWEIPIVAAFLLFGLKVGFSAAAINSAFLLTVYPSMAQPWYWLGSIVSVSSMMLGVLLAQRLMRRRTSEDQSLPRAKTLTASLALGMLFRVAFMAPVMILILSVLTYPAVPLLGVVRVVLPLQAVYNVIVATYMIPAGYLIAKVVSKNLKVGNTIV